MSRKLNTAIGSNLIQHNEPIRKYGVMAGRKNERLTAAGICALILALGTIAPVSAGQGTLQLSVQGYGTVHGRLENATIQPNGTVSLRMVVNDQLTTSQGAFPTSASGLWVGTLNGSTVGGQIQDVVGTVHICTFTCQDAHFVGAGGWGGFLNGSDAAGIFEGTIKFTNSTIPQIAVGQPIPVSGTWASNFEQTMSEMTSGIWSYGLSLAVAVCALVLAERRSIKKE
jgi:hypothetical protein